MYMDRILTEQFIAKDIHVWSGKYTESFFHVSAFV